MKVLYSFFLYFLLTSTAFSDDYIDDFSKLGFKTNINGRNVQVFVEKQKILDNFDKLKKMGIIRSFAKEKDAIHMEFSYSYAISIDYLSEFVEDYFKNNNPNHINTLKVKVFIMNGDIYGNNHANLAYSFDFDKNLYRKVNWENFDLRNFDKVVKNFHMSDWMKNKISNELMGNDNNSEEHENE